MWGLLRKVVATGMFCLLDPWSSAAVAYSPIRRTSHLGFGTQPTAIIRPQSQNSNIRHDCILSIGNFILMINNNSAFVQLPGNLSKTKKIAPYFRGNTGFPIYLFWKHFFKKNWYPILTLENNADFAHLKIWIFISPWFTGFLYLCSPHEK
jgi:hypothetical protein